MTDCTECAINHDAMATQIAQIEPLIIVYRAVNRINGNSYIGMTTKGLAWRRRGHKASANAGYDGVFNRAIRKHGFDAFDFSILEVCVDRQSALERERHLIAELKPRYNTAAGGLSGPQGWKHSEESRRRMRESHVGKPGPWRGKKRSAESIAKRTATRAINPVRPWLGKKRSPETIAKIKATRPFLPKPPPPTPETLKIWLNNMRSANEKRSIPVRCISDGLQFASIMSAARHYDINRKSILHSCIKSVPCKCGMSFEYVKKNDQQQHL